MDEPSETDNMLGSEDRRSPASSYRGRDRWNYVWWTAYYSGLASLFPWNMLITVTGYWNYKLRNVTLDDDATPSVGNNGTYEEDLKLTELQVIYNSYLAIAANVPNSIAVILTALFGYKYSTKLQIFGSQVMISLLFAIVSALAIVNSDEWQEAFLYTNLALIATLTLFNGVLQGAGSSIYGKFPVEIIGAQPVGSAIGGLAPSLLNILILGVQSDEMLTGFICFLVSVVVNLANIGLVAGLLKNEYFLSHKTSLTHDTKAEEDKRRLEEDESRQSSQQELPAVTVAQEMTSKYKDILKSAWKYHVSVLVIFSTTLVVFPAVVALIQPQNPDPNSMWKTVFFAPVCCFVVYNLFDLSGKYAATYTQWPGPSDAGQWTLLILSLLRIGMIPLFMYCNVAPNNRKTEVIFESEWWYLAFLVTFAFSNGYLGNIAFMFTPKVVAPENQEVAAAFAVSDLVIGCGLGSLLSTPVVKLL